MLEIPEEKSFDIRKHQLRWVAPRDLEDGQQVVIFVHGLTLIPYFAIGGSQGIFLRDAAKVERDDEGNITSIRIAAYTVPAAFYDYPKVVGILDD